MKSEKKLAILVSCFDYYTNRVQMVDEYLQSQGYETRYITSDFHHTKKASYVCVLPSAIQLHVRPYQKNLSADRILSHREFARGIYGYLEKLPRQPDLIYAVPPPNFMAKYLAKYKKKHPQVKLVFDIFDLWPETFPNGRTKKLLAPAFAIWGSLRDRALPAADRILTECDLFRQKLGLWEDPRAFTWHLLGCRPELDLKAQLPEDRLNLCYLGAINNIIDIPGIAGLVSQIGKRKPVCVHIIGKGERQEEFVQALEEAGAQVQFHGAIFDAGQKLAIMARCHLGLNMMKDSVCVGLTMKSVDYWSFDLPLVNNLPADTANLICQYGAGVNVGPEAVDTLCGLTNEDYYAMRRNVHTMYEECFAKDVIREKLQKALAGIL